MNRRQKILALVMENMPFNGKAGKESLKRNICIEEHQRTIKYWLVWLIYKKTCLFLWLGCFPTFYFGGKPTCWFILFNNLAEFFHVNTLEAVTLQNEWSSKASHTTRHQQLFREKVQLRLNAQSSVPLTDFSFSCWHVLIFFIFNRAKSIYDLTALKVL